MKKYFVTALCFFYSALSYSGEPANENYIDKSEPNAPISKSADVLKLDINTEPRYIAAHNESAPIKSYKLKGNKTMPSDSVKYLIKKFHDREHGEILHYRIDPNVDADMPRMALDPTVNAKIQKIYPHIGTDLLGLRKCPQEHHKFNFKK